MINIDKVCDTCKQKVIMLDEFIKGCYEKDINNLG